MTWLLGLNLERPISEPVPLALWYPWEETLEIGVPLSPRSLGGASPEPSICRKGKGIQLGHARSRILVLVLVCSEISSGLIPPCIDKERETLNGEQLVQYDKQGHGEVDPRGQPPNLQSHVLCTILCWWWPQIGQSLEMKQEGWSIAISW